MAQTTLVHGRLTAEYTAVTRPCTLYAEGRKRQCTWPVYTAKNGRAHDRYTAVNTRRYGPHTAVYTTRYSAVYDGVDGRFRQCSGPYTAVYTALVHVDTCTGPYTCRVHGLYMAVYTCHVRGACTRHVHGRRRPYRRPVHSHVHGWYRRIKAVPYTRSIHGRYTAVYGPFSRAKTCSRTVYTWCGLSANLECRSETCCTRLADNIGRKKWPKSHHLDTIPQLCRAISSELRHVSTIGKKLIKQPNLLNMSPQYGELWPTSG